MSTTIGAEGLHVSSPENIRIADAPNDFAGACLELFEEKNTPDDQAIAAARLVRENFSWKTAAARFEEILETSPMNRESK